MNKLESDDGRMPVRGRVSFAQRYRAGSRESDHSCNDQKHSLPRLGTGSRVTFVRRRCPPGSVRTPQSFSPSETPRPGPHRACLPVSAAGKSVQRVTIVTLWTARSCKFLAFAFLKSNNHSASLHHIQFSGDEGSRLISSRIAREQTHWDFSDVATSRQCVCPY